MKKKEVRCGVGVALFWEDKILLQLRSDNKKWGFIGGNVEFGETLQEACERETKEETGLILDTDDLIFVHNIYDSPITNIVEYPEVLVHKIDILFICLLCEVPVLKLNEESVSLEFFNFDMLPSSEEVSPQARQALQDAIYTYLTIYRGMN